MKPADEPVGGPGPADASVELVRIGHSYDGPLVVEGVSLRIEPGERVALVGASGAGKTTLAAIAAGVLMPTAGTVRLGGVDIRSLGEAKTQQQVALLSQEVHVFSGPLLDDVRLASPSATVEEVEAALELAGALGWVRALPDGLESQVGENAHQLTGAQAQQVALAHRLTQAEQADRIVVMDHGRVVESGTHADLLAAGGRYSQLWHSWTGTPQAMVMPGSGGPVASGLAGSARPDDRS